MLFGVEVLLAAEPGTTDPVALIIAIGGAAINALLILVVSLVVARAKRAEKEIHDLGDILTGREGMTVQIATLRGRLGTHEKAIEALERNTLPKDRFESATTDQNYKLDELRYEAKDLAKKLEKVNNAIAARPWSQGNFPATRPIQREDSSQSEPPPMRPRLPSRQPK